MLLSASREASKAYPKRRGKAIDKYNENASANEAEWTSYSMPSLSRMVSAMHFITKSTQGIATLLPSAL